MVLWQQIFLILVLMIFLLFYFFLNRRFSAWASSFGFGAAIYVAVVRNSIVFRNSVSADRSGMAASRFLAAASARVILLCFPAESLKSHCNGSMKVANGALAAYFCSFWRILCSSFSV